MGILKHETILGSSYWAIENTRFNQRNEVTNKHHKIIIG